MIAHLVISFHLSLALALSLPFLQYIHRFEKIIPDLDFSAIHMLISDQLARHCPS